MRTLTIDLEEIRPSLANELLDFLEPGDPRAILLREYFSEEELKDGKPDFGPHIVLEATPDRVEFIGHFASREEAIAAVNERDLPDDDERWLFAVPVAHFRTNV